MKNTRKILYIFIVLISSCTPVKNSINASSSPRNKPSPPSLKLKSETPEAYIKEAKLIAVGDIMMHGAQIKSGYDPQKKTYSYQGFFTEVKNTLSRGDWVMGNLETTLAGADLGGYTGYPMFNAPAELLDAIKAGGFNILTTANNHSLDRGAQGVIRTIKNIRDRGLHSTGTFPSEAEANKILIVNKNNIAMAILAYSYGTNGIPFPPGKNYLVNIIDEQKIIKDIAKAKKQGADVITICLHFGAEYQRQPNPQQKKLVENLIKAGADIILGSHPHVVQPYQTFQVPEKNGKSRTAVAIYSMGNFISNQTRKYTDIGVIFQVNIRKKFPDKTIEITKVDAFPTWVNRYPDNNKLNFRVLPIAEVLAQKKDPILPNSQYPVLDKYLQEMNTHLTSLKKTDRGNP